METIEIECDGKRVSAQFMRPTHKHTREMRKSVLPLYQDIKKMQKQLEAEDDNLDISKYLELSDKVNDSMKAILLDLHDKAVISKMEDFECVAEEDIQVLYDWLRKKTGATRSEEQERFLSNSGSAPK
jgi:hypothetical protein